MGRTAFGDNDKNRRLRHESKIGDPEPDDAQGTWPREQLEAMDRRFVARVERAIRHGRERRQSGLPLKCASGPSDASAS
jgi:hypothetical protein